MRFWWVDVLLVLLGLLAAFAMSEAGAGLAILAAITFIGLPVTLVLAAAPFLFLLFVIARIVVALSRPLPLLARLGLGFSVALAVLALIPLAENRRLEARLAPYIADDHDTLDGLDQPRILALVSERGGSCDELCQSLLLNGAVDAVISARHRLERPREHAEPLDAGLVGRMFFFEPRQVCPELDWRQTPIVGYPGSNPTLQTAELIVARHLGGDCLTARDAAIDEADLIVHDGVAFRAENFGQSDFSLTKNDARVFRQEVLRQTPGGKLQHVYRRTSVTYHELAPLLIPTYAGGYQLRLDRGLLRRERKLQSRNPSLTTKELVGQRLALDAEVQQADAQSALDDQVRAILAEPGPIRPDASRLVVEAYERAAYDRQRSGEQLALAYEVLQDRRISVPPGTFQIVRGLVEAGTTSPAELASLLFDRLMESSPEARTDKPTYVGWSVGHAASGIAALPDAAIAPHLDTIESLARMPERRVRAYRILPFLSIRGETAADTFLYLIDDAHTYKPARGVHENWQHPYLGAILGFCRLGTVASAAVPDLFARMADGRMVKFGPYWDMTIHMFVAMGADTERIWAHMQTDNGNHTRERFDREITRAQRRLDCSF